MGYRDERDALQARNEQLEAELAGSKADAAAMRDKLAENRTANLAPTATVVLTRTTALSDRLRAYQAMIDGQVVGEIRVGESLEVQVTPGIHHMTMKIDWCSSKPVAFEVVSGETASLECSSNLRGWRLLLGFIVIVFLRDQYIRLNLLEVA